MAEKVQDLSQLDDRQVEDLRNHLRDFVTGVKDPGSSFLDALIAGHGSTTHNSVKNPTSTDTAA
jgi:hypothetical protein